MKRNQSCSSSSTWAGESNSFTRWAGSSSWVWSSTVQESRLMASTLELFGPHWSLHFSIEHPLEDWRSSTAKLPTDHLCILLVKVSFTHWGPRLLRLHLQSAWTQTSPIHQPDRVWRERGPSLVLGIFNCNIHTNKAFSEFESNNWWRERAHSYPDSSLYLQKIVHVICMILKCLIQAPSCGRMFLFSTESLF